MDSDSLHLPTTEGQHQLCPFRPPAHPALGPWAAPPAFSHPFGLGEAPPPLVTPSRPVTVSDTRSNPAMSVTARGNEGPVQPTRTPPNGVNAFLDRRDGLRRRTPSTSSPSPKQRSRHHAPLPQPPHPKAGSSRVRRPTVRYPYRCENSQGIGRVASLVSPLPC